MLKCRCIGGLKWHFGCGSELFYRATTVWLCLCLDRLFVFRGGVEPVLSRG